MRNWEILLKWKRRWEVNMENCMDIEVENLHLNKWSSFEIFTSLELINLASKHGVKVFYFFIDPSESGKVFEIVEPPQLNAEIEKQLEHKNVKIRYTKGNALIASTEDIETAADILNLNEFLDTKVKVKLVTGNLFTNFVIRDVKQDIHVGNFINSVKIENDIPILSARRFFSKGKPTRTLQVTIPGEKIPKEVKSENLIIKAEKFIERPTQCYYCHQFGHIKSKCNTQARCAKCGIELKKINEKNIEEVHDVEKCKESICRNCKGNHKADDPNCPEYSKAVKIIEIKSRLHVPLFEAKRIYYKEIKSSYANIVKSKQESTEPKCDCEKRNLDLKKEIQSSLQVIKTIQEKEFDTFKEEIRNELKKQDALIKEKISQTISREELYHIIEGINKNIEGTIKFMNEQFYEINQKLNQIIVYQLPKCEETEKTEPESKRKKKVSQLKSNTDRKTNEIKLSRDINPQPDTEEKEPIKDRQEWGNKKDYTEAEIKLLKKFQELNRLAKQYEEDEEVEDFYRRQIVSPIDGIIEEIKYHKDFNPKLNTDE